MQSALAWSRIEQVHIYTACFPCQGLRIRHLRFDITYRIILWDRFNKVNQYNTDNMNL